MSPEQAVGALPVSDTATDVSSELGPANWEAGRRKPDTLAAKDVVNSTFHSLGVPILREHGETLSRNDGG